MPAKPDPPQRATDDQTAQDHQRFVPHGIAHVSLPAQAQTVNVSFALAHQFTMLAFASAVDPFRAANQLSGQMLFRWNVYSEDGKAVSSSNGIAVQPDGRLPTLAPQGYVFVCGGVEPETGCTAGLGDWIRAQWRHGRTVGGLCTGAYALARAGILKDRSFTLHWENIASFREQFPELAPELQVYCVDDRILTCAGGSAASDLSLTLIHKHFGSEISQAVMNMCLLTRQREPTADQTPSLASRLGTRSIPLLKAVAFLNRNFDNPTSIRDCAESIGVSTRQIERLFRANLGVTPARYLLDLRLEHGRELLSGTDMSVLEVAVACCFGSGSHFSKSFRKKYGVSPHDFSHFRRR
ncbi:MAG: GlxA family transcriptional regulator [Pseudorhodobacter sp.]